MESEKKAILHIGNVLANVSLESLAAIGGATANPILAGAATATFAAKEGVIALLRSPKGMQEEAFEISKPPWWNGDEQSWQDMIVELEGRLPRIIAATAEHLKRNGHIPTTERRQQAFQSELRSHLTSFLVGGNDQGMIANMIAPPFFRKVAVLLNDATHMIHEDTVAHALEEIAEHFTQQSVTQSSPLVTITTTQTGVTTSAQDQANMKAALLEQKWQEEKYDVYICYHQADREKMRSIDAHLKAEGILPWFDIRTSPEVSLQSERDEQIRKIPAAAVFIGAHAEEDWSALEIQALLNQFVERKIRVMPVFLETAPKKPEMSVFLELFTGVDFRQKDPDPFKQLMRGITGKRPPLSSL